MTPQEFYNNTVGKAYDIDGSYGYQCLIKGSIVLKADGTTTTVGESTVKDESYKYFYLNGIEVKNGDTLTFRGTCSYNVGTMYMHSDSYCYLYHV